MQQTNALEYFKTLFKEVLIELNFGLWNCFFSTDEPWIKVRKDKIPPLNVRIAACVICCSQLFSVSGQDIQADKGKSS